jgi:beta-glucosidase-like glycosyl hydrolase
LVNGTSCPSATTWASLPVPSPATVRIRTGVLSTAYGRGIQGPDPDHLLAAPALKRLLAYNNEAQRATSSSGLRPRVLREYDEQAFRPAIAADAATGVMTSYNLVNLATFSLT